MARAFRAASSPVRLGSTSAGASPDQESRELAGLAAWTKALDIDRAQLGLQLSLTLLASQSLLLLRAGDSRDQSLLRRELSAEMVRNLREMKFKLIELPLFSLLLIQLNFIHNETFKVFFF